MKIRGEGQEGGSHSAVFVKDRHLRLCAYSAVGTTERQKKLNVSVTLTP